MVGGVCIIHNVNTNIILYPLFQQGFGQHPPALYKVICIYSTTLWPTHFVWFSSMFPLEHCLPTLELFLKLQQLAPHTCCPPKSMQISLTRKVTFFHGALCNAPSISTLGRALNRTITHGAFQRQVFAFGFARKGNVNQLLRRLAVLEVPVGKTVQQPWRLSSR